MLARVFFPALSLASDGTARSAFASAGTVVVSGSLSSAAALTAIASRRYARSRGFSIDSIDETAGRVDSVLADKPWHTSLLLVFLLRLSPVLPFTFSNYLAGVTRVPISAFFLGTLLGTLPTQAAYVTAGALGRKALQDGVSLPLPLVALGVAATGAAILLIGHVATQALKGMHLDDEADGKKRKRATSGA